MAKTFLSLDIINNHRIYKPVFVYIDYEINNDRRTYGIPYFYSSSAIKTQKKELFFVNLHILNSMWKAGKSSFNLKRCLSVCI